MLQKIYIAILFSMCFFNARSSDVEKLEFSKNLTISEGLAHNGVTSILEDSKGYIWIGTYDGLNRYDGYEFKIYKNTIDKDLFVSNRIRTISEDENGNLWIGTDEGITIYEYMTGKFKNIYSNKLLKNEINGPIVRKIIISPKSNLVLCATEDAGILVFDKEYKFLKQYQPSTQSDLESCRFFDGIILDSLNFVFTTSKGAVHLDSRSVRFQRIHKEEVYTVNNSVIDIGENVLLLTLSSGIAFIKYEMSFNHYSFKLLSEQLKPYNIINASVDKNKNLWLGTYQEGVIHIDNLERLMNKKACRVFSYSPKAELLKGSCIISSERSGCWVGTYNNGIYQFNLNGNPFKSYNTAMNLEFGPKSDHIMQISPLDDHRALITANIGGMALFNTNTNRFEPLPFLISEEDILKAGSVFVDSKKNIWFKIGSGGGFYRVRAGSKKPEIINFQNELSQNTWGANSFAEDKYGDLIFAGIQGVFKIVMDEEGTIQNLEDLNANPFFRRNKISLVRFVYVDPLYDFIWVGTDTDGLLRLTTEKGKSLEQLSVEQYIYDKNNKHSVSSDFVTSILRLPNGELWIGTEGGGICKVVDSEKEPKFIPFTEKMGLSNNVVKSIWYDEAYNLWITTNIGLNKFDTKSQRFQVFAKEDGLPFEDFWYSSVCMKNGVVILSGLDGLCYFKPKELPGREELPSLEISNLRIRNKSILPGDTMNKRVLLNKPLAETAEISLKHNENDFSIELSSLHFSNPDNRFLKYQLLPISTNWVEVHSNQRYVYYNGLQPGEYTLQVMASNSLNEWTEPKELKIIISPPFWKTNLAYVLYLVLTALIAYLVIFFILKIQSLKYNLQFEQLEKDKVNEVNAAKLRFFSNISHEIKTPITLISGPVSILYERFKGNPDVTEKLQIVQRQSKKISQLVDQVHDFQRANANLLKMDSTRFSFSSFILDLMKDFEFKAKSENKSLQCDSPDKDIYILADKDKLEKVFNNLLNNAFKYTSSSDSIHIDYQVDGKDLIVNVRDTGRGIDSEDLPHIFERFYQSQKKHGAYTGGSGIGLAFAKRLVEMHYGYIDAESELNKGTTIKVRLPIITDKLSTDQHEKEQEILIAEKDFDSKEQTLVIPENLDIEIDGELSEAMVFLVEDNSEMRLFVAGVLSRYFKLRSFSNGQECLNAMEEEWPDIVISDVLMPEINGFELCKRIKSDIKTSHIPVVLLTACSSISDQLQGVKEGADAYIKKPFDTEYLLTKTESLLINRRKLRERFQIDFPLTMKKSKESSNDMAFLEKLYNLMENNLDNQDLDLDSFAKELYLNRTHFFQKVKALTNQTPYELLKSYRLKKACEFLVQDGMTINEVVGRTGFKSRAHFSKLFKEKYHQPPGQFVSESGKNIST